MALDKTSIQEKLRLTDADDAERHRCDDRCSVSARFGTTTETVIM